MPSNMITIKIPCSDDFQADVTEIGEQLYFALRDSDCDQVAQARRLLRALLNMADIHKTDVIVPCERGDIGQEMDNNATIDRMDDDGLIEIYNAFATEIVERDLQIDRPDDLFIVAVDSSTDDDQLIARSTSATNLKIDGLTFDVVDGYPVGEHTITGPTYTAKELRIIAAQAVVALASAPAVDDSVRLQAACVLKQLADDFKTAE
jgi:hypothetical protein